VGSAAPWSPPLDTVTLPESVTQSLSGNAATGAQLFQQRGCINCHQIAGRGGQRGPDLTHVGSRLRDYDLTWRILNGGRNMPAYGSTMRPDETAALVEFLLAMR
jgi:ubiquinol-cytochrome c reductase cytochrome b subunit